MKFKRASIYDWQLAPRYTLADNKKDSLYVVIPQSC